MPSFASETTFSRLASSRALSTRSNSMPSIWRLSSRTLQPELAASCSKNERLASSETSRSSQ